jgi:D-hexose-6-phosphate mutarotase
VDRSFLINVLILASFGPWANGPQHGFARIKKWSVKQPASQVFVNTKL